MKFQKQITGNKQTFLPGHNSHFESIKKLKNQILAILIKKGGGRREQLFICMCQFKIFIAFIVSNNSLLLMFVEDLQNTDRK